MGFELYAVCLEMHPEQFILPLRKCSGYYCSTSEIIPVFSLVNVAWCFSFLCWCYADLLPSEREWLMWLRLWSFVACWTDLWERMAFSEPDHQVPDDIKEQPFCFGISFMFIFFISFFPSPLFKFILFPTASPFSMFPLLFIFIFHSFSPLSEILKLSLLYIILLLQLSLFNYILLVFLLLFFLLLFIIFLVSLLYLLFPFLLFLLIYSFSTRPPYPPHSISLLFSHFLLFLFPPLFLL